MNTKCLPLYNPLAQVDAMEFHERLSFTVTILLVLGIVWCTRAYYLGGISNLKQTAVIWLAVSVITILFGRWLRRSGHVNK